MPSRSAAVHAAMPARRWLRRLSVAMLAAGLLGTILSATAGAQRGGALVQVLEVEGVIDGVVAGYVEDVVAEAEEAGAEVIALQLDVHGGLGDAADRVVRAIRESSVPVLVWVGPRGVQATGAGLHIAYAAHLLAVAPGSLFGDGVPADLTADPADDTVARSDRERLIELADARGRDLEAAQAAADGQVIAAAPAGAASELPADAALPDGVDRDDVVVVDEQDLVDRGIVDFTAASLPDALRALDGRTVTVAGDERPLSVDTVTATVRFNNLGLIQQVLHAVSNPTLAYLLLIGGALAIAFEVFQPGFGVAGFSGLVLAGFGVAGLVVLPVSWLAVAAALAGLLLLAVDLAIGRLGLLTAGGAGLLALGSFRMFGGPEALRVPAWVLVLVVLTCVVYFVGVMTTVLRAQGNQALAGAEKVVGQTGVVRSMLNPEGHIFAGGALWRARAPEGAGKVKTGTPVRVVGLNDSLTLDVEVIDSSQPEETARV